MTEPRAGIDHSASRVAANQAWEDFVDEYVLQTIELADTSLRHGQILFNLLAERRPDVAERLRGTSVDCFYNDALIPTFLNEAWSLWED